MDTKTMKAAVIDALEEIKAKNIVVLNVSKLTSLFDYLVVATGDSNRQTRALANNVKERLKQRGAHVYGSEGEDTGEWVLVDLGDIVVHVMQPAIRDYYTLEELWREGKVEYPKPAARKPGLDVEGAATPAAKAPRSAAKKPAPGARKTSAKTGARSGAKAGAGGTAARKRPPAAGAGRPPAGTGAKPPRTAAKTAKTPAGGTKKTAARKPAAPRTRKP